MATVAFWFGAFLALAGSVITFYPGAECGWFVVSGALIAPGLLIPKPGYRIAALFLCVLCFLYAYFGYAHGVEYEMWLRTR